MSAIGLRELKNNLSRYVQRARSGETLFISDRGEIVAELSPPKKISATGEAITSLNEMRRKGLLHGGGPNAGTIYPPLRRALKRRSAAQLLDEERGEK